MMITLSSESQHVTFSRGTFNVTNFDWEIKTVVFRFKRPKKSINMLGFVGFECSLWILNFKNFEVIV